jgi:hypothetical protein
MGARDATTSEAPSPPFDLDAYDGLALETALGIELQDLFELARELEAEEPGSTGLFRGPATHCAVMRQAVQEHAARIVVLVALKAPRKLHPQGLDQLMSDAWLLALYLEPSNLDDLAQLGAQAVLSEHLDQLLTDEIVRVVLNYRTNRA